jgi:hypothetical protein
MREAISFRTSFGENIRNIEHLMIATICEYNALRICPIQIQSIQSLGQADTNLAPKCDITDAARVPPIDKVSIRLSG